MIFPRQKQSDEVRTLLSEEGFSRPKNKDYFPASMRKIIHKFMVANRYAYSAKDLGPGRKQQLFHSLLYRLDLQQDAKRGLPKVQQIRLGNFGGMLGSYIRDTSIEWQQYGILLPVRQDATPQFHRRTQAWLLDSWTGDIGATSPRVKLESPAESDSDKAKIVVKLPPHPPPPPTPQLPDIISR